MTRVLVACGTGLATAAVIAQAVTRALRERGVDVETDLCAVSEVAEKAPGHALVVSTTPIAESGGVPVVHTLAFLTGVDVEGVVNRMMSVLQGGAAG